MKFKIATYNVSGGFYIGDESTEYLDREAAENIDNTLLNKIIEMVNAEEIDVLTLQEVITTERVRYIDQIKEGTNLKYSEVFELSPCNIVKNTNCGVAILSKYPLSDVEKEIFTNPKLAKTTDSGNTYYTYDKGWLACTINIKDNSIKLLTHHGFPYRRFNSTPEENTKVFEEFDNIIERNKFDIVTGDFNAENFMKLMNYTSSKYKRTINSITTVDDKKFDDILIFKEKEYTSKIIKSLSDHFIIIVELSI